MRDRTYMGMREQLHRHLPPPPSAEPSLLVTLVVFVLMVGFFLWAVLGHPTPAERERTIDSMGQTTGVNWR